MPAELRSLTLLCDRFGALDVNAAIDRCLRVGLARAVDIERVLVDPATVVEPAALPVDLSGYDRIPRKKEPRS